MEQRKRSWLTRRDNVELFEQRRREHEFGVCVVHPVQYQVAWHFDEAALVLIKHVFNALD